MWPGLIAVSRGVAEARDEASHEHSAPVEGAPWVGLSLMPDDAFRAAAAPLFAAGEVDALEWSFDTGWGARLPVWLEALLAHYGEAGRLLGHGVHYSPLSAVWEARQDRWLDALSGELTRQSYVHISEHYGFMTAAPFVRGAPLPAPRGDALLRVGRDHLRKLRERLACPLGLENLALAWSRDEALAHGPFLDTLLAERDFIVLDLHNLYCQAANFGLEAEALLATYPLARVREVHVSGGSWQPAWPNAESKVVRCDTHDAGVPEPVFAALRVALGACPNLRVVILEQLGQALASPAQAARFRADFRRIRELVEVAASSPPKPLAVERMSDHVVGSWSRASEAELAAFQSGLLQLLRVSHDACDVHRGLLREPAFSPFAEQLGVTDEQALGIAARVVKKWTRL